MKNIFYFFLAIFSILAVSCNNNEQPKIDTQNEYVFSEEEIENINDEEVNNELFDSTIYSSEDVTERSWVSYYKNGVIKEKGQHVNFNGCGMYEDTLFFYDTLGNLYKTEYYENYSPFEGASCHETRTNILIREYYSNGKLKATKQLETCYECEETRKGVWTYFSQSGEIDSTMIYTP